MEITKELILNVAKNARLHLTEEEIQEFIPQFKEVLTAFEKIKKTPTEHVKPTTHPLNLKNSLREDIPKESTSQETILSNTQHKKDGYFLGPKTL